MWPQRFLHVNCHAVFNRKVQGRLPELSTQKVVNKHRRAKENIEKRYSNKKYFDMNKHTKASNIKRGDTVICQQKPTNKLSQRFNPERLTTLRREGATVTPTNDRHTITRNVSHFEVVNPVEEQVYYWASTIQLIEHFKLSKIFSERLVISSFVRGYPCPLNTEIWYRFTPI